MYAEVDGSGSVSTDQKTPRSYKYGTSRPEFNVRIA